MSTGLLIAFEGCDGSGKSTQIRRLSLLLTQLGVVHTITGEPTRGPWGRLIRESATTSRMTPAAELHALMEDRREHVRDVIRPALSAGRMVLTDRYYPSMVAYQGARGADPVELLAMSEAMAPRPDLTLIFEIPVADAVARIERRGDASAFEGADELARVAEIYETFNWPGVVRIDARGTATEVAALVTSAFWEALR